MAIRLLNKPVISTFGNLNFAFLNKQGNEIPMDRIIIHEVFLKFRGTHDLTENCTTVNNHLSVFIDSNKIFPKKLLKFDIHIRYSFKSNKDKILKFKKTIKFEPLLCSKPKRKNQNSNRRRN